ncbi:tripartite tricarboxylate transporter substrate binding protein [Sporolituus thermophilus]|uniref:Putative tricarboxylic transport membrane protein n=1 Tax=Sporolituus thermophilus DSM 23256 TaxID=1123285 RepID=A0A1G7L8M3_9FIRM|nr:tripartite tricarboxylate transporter substrate binding protein [Sporolituus thermophilus]SDF45828.1 putative tricarboxylic transport membrane protein [Sporolituus thermophilus DSM 23256]
MRIRMTSLVALLLVLVMVVAGCGSSKESAKQQPKYPNGPITIIAPAGPGSGWDLTARSVAQVLTEKKIVPVAMPVENRAGGGGVVASSHIIENKKGDAHTLVVYSPPLLLTNLNGQTKNSYKDLTPIARLFSDYEFFGVKKDSKYKSLKEVLEALKADPKSVKVGGASAPGSMDHLAFMMAASKAGVNIKEVPYISFQGGGELIAALLGGSIDVISTSVGDVLGQVEAGNIRGLAVTSPERLKDPRVANIPTLKEQGIDATFEVWRGIFGPPNMPEHAKKYMVEAIEKMSKTEEWANTCKKYSWVPTYAPADEFTKFLDEQNKMLGDLLRSMNLIK